MWTFTKLKIRYFKGISIIFFPFYSCGPLMVVISFLEAHRWLSKPRYGIITLYNLWKMSNPNSNQRGIQAIVLKILIGRRSLDSQYRIPVGILQISAVLIPGTQETKKQFKSETPMVKMNLRRQQKNNPVISRAILHRVSIEKELSRFG